MNTSSSAVRGAHLLGAPPGNTKQGPGVFCPCPGSGQECRPLVSRPPGSWLLAPSHDSSLRRTFHEDRQCAEYQHAGAGCRVQGAGCRVQGTGCRVQGAGCRVQGAGTVMTAGDLLSPCQMTQLQAPWAAAAPTSVNPRPAETGPAASCVRPLVRAGAVLVMRLMCRAGIEGP